MKRILVFLIILVAFDTSKASSSDITGNPVFELCKEDVFTCGIFAVGFQSGVYVGETYPSAICIPDTTTLGQLGEVLVKYMEEHPAERHKPIGAIASSAFLIAFRCNQ